MSSEYTVLQFPITSGPTATNESAIQEMVVGLKKLIEIGAIKGKLDDILKDYEVSLLAGYTKAYLEPGVLYDASKLSIVGSAVSSNLCTMKSAYSGDNCTIESAVDGSSSEEQKLFSVSTIQERLRLAKRNPKIRLRMIVMDYKKFFEMNRGGYAKEPEKFSFLKDMFITDMMGLFREILPYIEEGKQLSTLLGLSQVSPKMTKSARELSLIYRRALRTEKSSGQINKGIWEKLKLIYDQFLSELCSIVFPGSSELKVEGNKKAATSIQSQLANLQNKTVEKKYSYGSDGRVRLFD